MPASPSRRCWSARRRCLPKRGRSRYTTLAFVSQLFGHTAINAAVRVLIEPVVAAIAAAFVFGEQPAPFTAAGALLIFAAIAVALRAETAAAISV